MITSIVVGRGNKRTVFVVPAEDRSKPGWPNGRIRVGTQKDRLAVGNLLKSRVLWPNGRGFRAAKSRGEMALSR